MQDHVEPGLGSPAKNQRSWLESKSARLQLTQDAVAVLNATGSLRSETTPFLMAALGRISAAAVKLNVQGLEDADDLIVELDGDEDEGGEVEKVDLPSPPEDDDMDT